jgi:ABC transport system ATP-binding/permease protein
LKVEPAFLQIVAGVRRGLKVPLHEGKNLEIGRKRGDLILHDPLVSAAHCRITQAERAWRLVDLGSTNGTIVDGQLVREVALKPGSEITVGSSKMILFVGDDPRREADKNGGGQGAQLDIAWLLDEELVEVGSTPMANRGGVGEGSDRPPASGASAPKADVIDQDLRLPPGLNAVVEVIAGLDAGKVFRFNRGNIAIGRRQGEVPLTDVEVSRHHAVIEIFGRDMLFLRDLGSTNGTYHNARRVSVGKLQSGDTVGCGKTILRLEISR